ncbi:MAG: tRNA-dihydrouridine synthase family protein, partial [Clostridiaceae bacterium]|nr:tRNA-dihydrouridine synthase family protein [Clostridiaceae bacterium]
MIKFENNQDFVQNFIKKPLIVNNLEIKNRLALAPLAGTSDTIFRTFSSQYGAGLVTTELVSAKGICYDPYLTKNYRYLEINPKKDSKIAIQLFGHEPYSFQKAIETILEHPILKECHIIDINMGCPVKKVVKQGAGSALMRTPELAEEIVKTARAITESHNKLLSVKFRSGWDQSQINAVNFAKRLEAVGAELITLHARTRKQMYQGKADWEIIKKVKAAVKIPVYGNGDLSDLDSIMKMYQKTG